jgi:hypothetical protein
MERSSDAFQQPEQIQANDINRNICQLIQRHCLDQAAEICDAAFQQGTYNKETYIFYLLFLIRQKEIERQEPQTFDLSSDPDVLINHYHTLKFLIRRQEFPQMTLLRNELYTYCREFHVSRISLAIITQFSTIQPKQILKKIWEGLVLYEQL